MSSPIRLPNELWIRVLQNITADDELPFLFITCRGVNGVFRHFVESKFREHLLPRLSFTFTLGDYSPPIQDHRRPSGFPLTCEFTFHHLSEEDEQTVILEIDDLPSDLLSIARKRMREVISDSNIEFPSHTIQIRREITDGPLPALAFSPENMQISCNWTSLFCSFYGEQFLYRDLLARAIEGRKSWLEELKRCVARKETGSEQVIIKALAAFAEDDQEARKVARRARIRKQWEGVDPEWSFERDGDLDEETKTLGRLQRHRQWVSLEEWSDEEEGDEDEDEDEDGEEGDGDESLDGADGWETDDDQDLEADIGSDEERT